MSGFSGDGLVGTGVGSTQELRVASGLVFCANSSDWEVPGIARRGQLTFPFRVLSIQRFFVAVSGDMVGGCAPCAGAGEAAKFDETPVPFVTGKVCCARPGALTAGGCVT